MYMAEMHILWVELVQFILLVSLSETAMHLSRLFRRANPHFLIYQPCPGTGSVARHMHIG